MEKREANNNVRMNTPRVDILEPSSRINKGLFILYYYHYIIASVRFVVDVFVISIVNLFLVTWDLIIHTLCVF